MHLIPTTPTDRQPHHHQEIREMTMSKHRHHRGRTNRKPPYKWAIDPATRADRIGLRTPVC